MKRSMFIVCSTSSVANFSTGTLSQDSVTLATDIIPSKLRAVSMVLEQSWSWSKQNFSRLIRCYMSFLYEIKILPDK